MAISFNTGATGHAETASSCTLAIPAGVLVGDVMIMALELFTETGTTPTISFSGAGGSWTAVPMNTGSNPEVATAGSSIWSYGFAYYRVATAGDQGATLTITESGSAAATTWFAVAMGAYTGANTSSPIDVAAGNNAQGTSSGTGPTINTVAANDWALQLACAAINSSPLSGPATSRENVVSSADIAAALDDGNSAVAAGTNIGGGTWTQSGNTSDWWSLFTIGLAVAVAGGISGKVEPLPTIPIPRRKPSRVVTGFTPVTTFNTGHGPAGTAQPLATFATPPRRRPSRVVTGFTPVRTFNTGHGPAGTVQPEAVPAVMPRRRPARASVQFVPVKTTNNLTPVVAPPTPPPLGGGKSMLSRYMRWADL